MSTPAEKLLADVAAKYAHMYQPRTDTSHLPLAAFRYPPLPAGATVNPVYNAYCADCNEGDGPHDDEDDAQAWVDAHNAEYHG